MIVFDHMVIMNPFHKYLYARNGTTR